MKTVKKIIRFCLFLLCSFVYRIGRLFPLKREVVASSFYGKIYGNNTKYVVEALHSIDKNLKLYWMSSRTANYALPSYVLGVKSKMKEAFLYGRSKVIINTHFVPKYFKRRKRQLYIMMYHGGIGIKKNSNSVPGRKMSRLPQNNAKAASYIISNSLFMNKVIRECLVYTGPIWMTGYPKNDLLHTDAGAIRAKVRNNYGIEESTKIVVYAPTYRLDLSNADVFDIDFDVLVDSLKEKFGGEWVAFFHLHPHQQDLGRTLEKKYGKNVINATGYEDMQELILASDCLVSDYSSCIFEAAERDIPCISYASDYETYRYTQGFFFRIEDLPFPYCKNNIELKQKILSFDYKDYLLKWGKFKKEQGLIETSQSSMLIARTLISFLDGQKAFENEVLVYE